MRRQNPFWGEDYHAGRRPRLLQRARIVAALRAFFAARDFLEIEPSALQVSPGNETHIAGFATQFCRQGGIAQPLYLHSSPEFDCKKLLAAGEKRIFALAHVFRNGERSKLHHPEFTMLEWYRAGVDYRELIEDCAEILAAAAKAAGVNEFCFGGMRLDPFAPPEILPVTEAFRRYAGIDLLEVLDDREAFAAQALRLGLRVTPDDHWSDLFSKVLSDRIEGRLGEGRATVLIDYPASEAALARRKPGDARFAERFELYGCGVELANAFGELTDAAEQRRRFAADMEERRRIYGESYPIDEDFLQALAFMPEASGIALGLDRLVMLATHAENIDQVFMGAGGQGMSHLDRTLTAIDDLIAAGLVDRGAEQNLSQVAALYSVAVPGPLARLIEHADDPIGRQFLPRAEELRLLPEENADPIGDGAHQAVKGLIHRYPDRVLLKLTSVCPVYCRFCFRRASVGAGTEGLLDDEALDAAFAYIAEHKEIWEVIVTGGDPLAVAPRRLAGLSRRLAQLPHVKILRFHSRVPVLTPERVTPDLIAALKSSGKTVYVAVHANHTRELTPVARSACADLADSGIALVSQTVLLRGVNDDVETLSSLMRAFVEMRVKPYYLHHGDLAPGTAHFRLSLTEGQNLVRQLLGRLSGLCQPIYVVDIPGGHGKAPAGPLYFSRHAHGWTVEDWRGIRHDYVDSVGQGGNETPSPTPTGFRP